MNMVDLWCSDIDLSGYVFFPEQAPELEAWCLNTLNLPEAFPNMYSGTMC